MRLQQVGSELLEFTRVEEPLDDVRGLYGSDLCGKYTVSRRFQDVDARRVHQTRSWVVSFSILSEFGRDSGSREGTGLAVVLSRAREVRGRAGGAATA